VNGNELYRKGHSNPIRFALSTKSFQEQFHNRRVAYFGFDVKLGVAVLTSHTHFHFSRVSFNNPPALLHFGNSGIKSASTFHSSFSESFYLMPKSISILLLLTFNFESKNSLGAPHRGLIPDLQSDAASPGKKKCPELARAQPPKLVLFTFKQPQFSLLRTTMAPQRTRKSRARYYTPPPEFTTREGHAETPHRSAVIAIKLVFQEVGLPLNQDIIQKVTTIPPRSQTQILASKQVRDLP
jgi:hypothetical protein